MVLGKLGKLKQYSDLFAASAAFRGTQNMALTTIALLVRDKLGLGPSTIGVIGAVAGASMVASTFLVSSRAKPHQLERSVIAGSVLLIAALVVIGASQTVWEVIVGAILLGVSGGLGLPGLTGVVQRAARTGGVGSERLLALYTLVLSGSLAVAPLVEAFLLEQVGQDVRWPFFAFTVFPIITIAAMVSRMRHAPANPSSTATGSADRPPRRRAISLHPVQKALVAQLMYAVPFAGITVFGAEVARAQAHATAAQAQLAFTAFFATSLLSRAVLAWLAPVKRKSSAFILSGVLTLAGIAIIATGHSFAFFLIGMAVIGVPHGIIFPLGLSLLADSLAPEELPRANSTLIGASNLVSVAVPPLLGEIAVAYGYEPMMLSIDAPALILLAVLAYLLYSHSVAAGRTPLGDQQAG